MKPPPFQLDIIDPERFARLQKLLDGVIDLSPEEISAAVDRLSEGDVELRAAAMSLLHADRQLDNVAEDSPTFLSIATAARIGRAKLPDDDPRLAEILASEVVAIAGVQGNEAAEPWSRDVVSRFEKIYGREHPRTITAAARETRPSARRPWRSCVPIGARPASWCDPRWES